MEQLPNEIVFYISTFFTSIKDYCAFGNTCREVYSLVQNEKRNLIIKGKEVVLNMSEFVIVKRVDSFAFDGHEFIVRRRDLANPEVFFVLRCYRRGRNKFETNAVRSQNKIEANNRMSKYCMSSTSPCGYSVPIYYRFQNTKYLFTVSEYVPGLNLWGDVVSEVPKMPFSVVFQFACELVYTFCWIHCHDLCLVNEIMPEHFTVDNHGHIRLTCYNVCATDRKIEKLSIRCISGFNSVEYMAPEVLLCTAKNEVGTAQNWWNLGLLLYELVTRTRPFWDESPPVIYQNIISKDPPSLEDAKKDYLMINGIQEEERWKQFSDLVTKLLNKNAEKRLGERSIKQHPVFDNVDWNKVKKMQAVEGGKLGTELLFHRTTNANDQQQQQLEEEQKTPPLEDLKQFFVKEEEEEKEEQCTQQEKERWKEWDWVNPSLLLHLDWIRLSVTPNLNSQSNFSEK